MMFRRTLTFGLVVLLEFLSLGCKPIEKSVQSYTRKRMGVEGAYVEKGYAYCKIGETNYFSRVKVGKDKRESMIIAAHYATAVATFYLPRLENGTIDLDKDGFVDPDEFNTCLKNYELDAKFAE